MDETAEHYAEYVADDPHPVAKGDSVKVKLECSEDGKPMPRLTTEGRTYTTGAGYMPDGFDENIIGMNVGETKEFTFEARALTTTATSAPRRWNAVPRCSRSKRRSSLPLPMNG